jgi:flagellar basal body-associated protein FliL
VLLPLVLVHPLFKTLLMVILICFSLALFIEFFFFSLDNEGETCESPLNSDDQADANSSLTGDKYMFHFVVIII